MKKIIHGLLAAAAVMSPVMVQADVANKTIMADRGTLSSNVLINRGCEVREEGEGKKDNFGADVSVAGFFRQSYNKTKLAKYFGGGTDAIPAGNIQVAAGTATTTALNGSDIDFVRTSSNAMSGNVSLAPRHTEAGAQLNWNQCLNKFVDGLGFNVSTAVVYARNEMRPTYDTMVASATGGLKNISDFFAGTSLGKTTPGTTSAIQQDALAKQVISTTYTSSTNVADVSGSLSYQFAKDKNYAFGARITGLVPTGNQSTGATMFEVVTGNRSFFLGGGLLGNFNLYRSDDKSSSLNLFASADYAYGFAADRVRTLGMNKTTTGTLSKGEFITVGAVSSTHGMPLANVSTLTVSVEPRSRLEAVASLCYRYNRFSANVAYNLFYAQAETVTLKSAWDATAYVNPNAAIGSTETTSLTMTTSNGALVLAPGDLSGTYSLDLAPATTPAQVVHKVGGNVNYSFDTKTPIKIGAGADVDFSANNQAINTFGVWAQIGFSF